MPELSRFYGIVVRMYFDDDQQHSLPHIHVYYGGMDASYSLQGKLLGGKIPPKQEKLLLAWIALHEQELQENKHRASKTLSPIRSARPSESGRTSLKTTLGGRFPHSI